MFYRTLSLLGLLISGSGVDLRAETLKLDDGDTVVWIGNTVVERDREAGHLETALTLATAPEASVRFRNLGWSGDTVFGDARSYFGPPEEGFERLMKSMDELNPSLVFSCYGAVAAMSEDEPWTSSNLGADLPAKERFLFGYERLLDGVIKASGPQLREIVLVSPPPLENLGAPYPDQAKRNRRLAEYRDAIAELARKRGHRFVDLFALMGGDTFSPEPVAVPLTENGVHYTALGYERLAQALLEGLELPALPYAGTPEGEALRLTVQEKNRLFFHRWRPANETYLFLFRKHEQGQNAKEIPQFDPLVEAQEKKINIQKKAALEGLRKP